MREKTHRLPREFYRGEVSVAFTLCLHGGAQAFTEPEIAGTCSRALASAIADTGCIVPVYCFMPDHQHVVITGTHSTAGWPSFTRPLEPGNIVEREDRHLFYKRTEVRSKHADSHLGHVFDDGPAPTGLRFCLNSASLRFIPLEKLEEEGFGEYLSLFKKE